MPAARVALLFLFAFTFAAAWSNDPGLRAEPPARRPIPIQAPDQPSDVPRPRMADGEQTSHRPTPPRPSAG